MARMHREPKYNARGRVQICQNDYVCKSIATRFESGRILAVNGSTHLLSVTGVWQELVDEFQKQSNSGAKLATIEDMQNFVEGFSEFSAAQRNAGKHVTLITELSRHVDSRNLMQVSSVSASPS